MTIKCPECGEYFEKVCEGEGCAMTYTCPYCGYSNK